MKKYNKPVVEINCFEVEDILVESVYGNWTESPDSFQSVVNDYSGGEVDTNEKILYYSW